MKFITSYFRRNSFDIPFLGKDTIGDVIMRPLSESTPVVLDVGARNGMMMLPESYAQRSHLLGLEPNETEYKKLIDSDTDAHKVGADIPKFKIETYLPYALWNKVEERNLDITIGPGACTMMGDTIKRVTSNMVMDMKTIKGQSFEELHAKVLRKEKVNCTSLDAISNQNKINKIDFLKLDCEGAELNCLLGADSLLSRQKVLMVYSEFVALRYYNDHATLADQLKFLEERGYRLIALDLGHEGYQWKSHKLSSDKDRRLLHAGDYWACVDPDKIDLTPEDMQRLAALSIIFGFNSLGLNLLSEAGYNSIKEINRIADLLSSAVTFKRIKRAWQKFPDTIRGL